MTRLSKAARDFNVGISTIVEFLKKKGVKITGDPNEKISNKDYDLVAREFTSDRKQKNESNKVELGSHRKTKNINKNESKESELRDSKPKGKEVKNGKEDTQKKFIAVKDEINTANKITVTGHIDLDEISGKTSKIKAKSSTVEKSTKTNKIKVKEEIKPSTRIKKVIKLNNSKKVENIADTSNNVIMEKIPEEKHKEVIFKKDTPNIPDIKVIGTIDLNAINQRTRPPKKSKAEKEKDRKESRKTKNGGASNSRNNATHKNSTEGNKSTTTGSPDRKKRKRIVRQGEKVVINNNNNTLGDKTTRTSDVKKKLKKLKKKKQGRAEITGEAVDKQIKDTFARFTRSRSNTSRHRRDKRDAVHQKIQNVIKSEEKESRILKLTEFVTVAELASMMDIGVTDIISTCMSLGLFVSINQRLDAETINLVVEEFGFKVEFVSIGIQEAIDEEEEEKDSEENLVARPPIVTVMGHVDHGKTSLLDYIRKENVIAGEAGGITQHIGAYSVKLADGRMVTFLDTPGHEAFTAMRARGAQVTDIAIIIIAADDNVMPQTIEAINHASAAGVPIVFAINKIDKPGANPERIKEELAKMNFLVEEWGGKYQSQDIAAKKGTNIKELLEKVLLEAEMLDLKANPKKRASGSVIESSLDKGRGYVATVLVQNGTLHVGDIILSGQHYGHIKAMFNERGGKLESAGPAEPALILGLNGAPQAGDKFNVMIDEHEVKNLANKREQLQREQGLRTQKHITLDEIGRRIAIGNFQELNIIVKGDVDGSIEALSDALIKLSTEEIQVNIIHKAVGQISEGDVTLAAASNAIIVGFQVRPSVEARRIAEVEEIDIRLYSVIYKAIEEITSAMEGMLSPEIKEEITSTVEILEIFKITKVGTIAGCLVREGKITRGSKIRVIRDGIVVHSGTLASLKRLKDDAKEVAKGFECGLSINNYDAMEIGDMIESYEEVEVKKTL